MENGYVEKYIPKKTTLSDGILANLRPPNNSNMPKVSIVKWSQNKTLGPEVSFLAYPNFWKISVFNANFKS